MLRWLGLVMMASTALAAIKVGDSGVTVMNVGPVGITEGVAGGVRVFSAAVVDTPEMLWLKLDDSAATKVVVNSADTGIVVTNTAADTSALAVEGKIGGAFAYTSTHRSVCSDSTFLTALGGTQYSFAFWAKRALSTVHAAWFHIPFAPPENVAMCYFNKDNSTLFWYYFATSGGLNVSKQFSMPANTWYHFAFTRRNTTFKLYVNGALASTVEGTPIYTPLSMGFGVEPTFSGNTRTMDDIRFYDFTLSAADVAFLYNAGNGTADMLTPDPDTYVTVTFDPAGGSVSPETKEVMLGAAYGTLPTPTLSGCTFTGWVNGVPEQVTAETVVTDAAAHTLTAQWNAVMDVTIYFDAGDGYADYVEALYTPGSMFGSLPMAYNNYQEYVFDYWVDSSYTPIDIYSTVPSEGTTYYAHYSWYEPPQTYTVYLDPNGGIVEPSTFSNIPYETTYEALELPAPYLEGYNFDGWLSSYHMSIVGIGNYYCVYADDTLTAQWSPQ